MSPTPPFNQNFHYIYNTNLTKANHTMTSAIPLTLLFPPFPLLPIEIRLRIWEYVYYLYPRQVAIRHNGQDFSFRADSQLPPNFFVYRESRFEVLRTVQPLLYNGQIVEYFNAACDTLAPGTGPDPSLFEPFKAATRVVVKWEDEEWIVRLLCQFPKLEKLSLIMPASSIENCHSFATRYITGNPEWSVSTLALRCQPPWSNLVLNIIDEGRIQELGDIEMPELSLRIHKERTHHRESGPLPFGCAFASTF
jgi:hypothetical protein